eukprot:COSAG05_NODE_2139_length_3490_cov_9.342714_3_plen_267_part_00
MATLPQAIASTLRLGIMYSVLGVLLSIAMPVREEPLYAAAIAGDASEVAALLESGADPTLGQHVDWQALYWPVQFSGTWDPSWHNTPPLAPFVASSPLWGAAAAGHTSAVEALLKGGAEVHAGYTVGPAGSIGWSSPLHVATVGGHVGTMAALLGAGADARALGECAGPFGLLRCDVPLYTAVQGGFMEAVQLLMQHGAVPDEDRGNFLGSPGPTAVEAAEVRPCPRACSCVISCCDLSCMCVRALHSQEHGEEKMLQLLAKQQHL